ncbi:DUF3397 domain-containing protein [Paenibacillus pasadenensis]|uniref:DUF3397 domain-containing protein n=1 Tax=Paenibacillus pasadenensis TaxID=217090 RepID=A0A2N5N846_9BACL|nr:MULTISPECIES: DUF3397 domain-containing protein [Paenibacillus]PLT46498.1 hypothetical protein B8V81_4929 [Paenibacillus pasadenensis]QGG56907.1 DUF3397 family protein [Paenibacillus sp. B01]
MFLWDLLKTIYAVLAAAPFLPFAAVYLGSRMLTGDKGRSFRLAMDVTTLLLIGCVAVLFNRVFSNSFGLYGILLLMLLGGGLIGNLQHRKRGEIDAAKAFRAVWRAGFFVMGFLYVVLMATGITQHLLRL